MEVGLSLGLENSEGSMKLSIKECGCNVENISIKLDGGASWLYQGYDILKQNWSSYLSCSQLALPLIAQ